MIPARSTLFVLFLLACPMFAAAQTDSVCGPANVNFDIRTTKQAPASPAAQSGKALVYFLQDDLKYNTAPRPTTRFAVDGTWVGATHANSYFYVFVDPGEHHVCANWQSARTGLSWIGPKRSTAATHFTADAGQTYYFRARDIAKMDDNKIVSEPEVLLSLLDSDEARAVIQSFSFSISHPRK
ncbi:MAG TPA: DUF2846 domain-containing protein [Candidatus Acidoferrales bacterium]|nr:DUF2846 domain-containing protein [Candidatus Acidoferrales bacterium]